MKKNLLTAFIAIAALGQAQPVLQETNLAPVGFTASLSVGAAVAPGSGGANQTWNFSSLSLTPAGTFSIVAPGTTPCGSLFTTANYAYALPGPQYMYYDRSSSKLDLMGEQWPASCTGGTTYTNYKQVMQFPFNYNSSFSDPWVSNGGSGSFSNTYDGYGTLITPFGTYTNVMRFSIIDGTSNNSTLWITSGYPSYWVMLISPNQTLVFSNASVGVEEIKKPMRASVFPNPGSGQFTFHIENSSGNASVEVYDMTGKQILTQHIKTSQDIIDLRDHSEGMYFYKLMENGKYVSGGKFVVSK